MSFDNHLDLPNHGRLSSVTFYREIIRCKTIKGKWMWWNSLDWLFRHLNYILWPCPRKGTQKLPWKWNQWFKFTWIFIWTTDFTFGVLCPRDYRQSTSALFLSLSLSLSHNLVKSHLTWTSSTLQNWYARLTNLSSPVSRGRARIYGQWFQLFTTTIMEQRK